jgi:hypothetical protein
MLTIGIGNLGRRLDLKKEDIKKWNGTMEPFNFLNILTRASGVKNIVILCRNNWKTLSKDEKLEIDPYNKIIDLYTECDIYFKKKYSKIKFLSARDYTKPYKNKWLTFEEIDEYKSKVNDKLYEYIYNFKKDLKIDYNFSFSSNGFARINSWNYIRKDPVNFFRPIFISHHYAGYIIEYYNKSKIPWSLFVCDPRQVTGNYKKGFQLNHYDVYNLPQNIFSQITANKCRWKRINMEKNNGEFEYISIDLKYEYIERLCTALTTPNLDSEKDILFTIANMQIPGNNKLDKDFENDWRLTQIKKYILDNQFKDINIWGTVDKWVSDIYPQFKGLIHYEELNEQLKRTKYTFIIPLERGWSSAKYLETLLMGVFPFFHKEYDIDGRLIPKDHFCVINTENELKEKIEYLENNPEIKKQIFKELYQRLVEPSLNPQWLLDMLTRNTGLNFGKYTIESVNNISKRKLF